MIRNWSGDPENPGDFRLRWIPKIPSIFKKILKIQEILGILLSGPPTSSKRRDVSDRIIVALMTNDDDSYGFQII